MKSLGMDPQRTIEILRKDTADAQREVHILQKQIVDSYISSRKEIETLQTENAELKARLEKAVEVPCNVGDKIYWYRKDPDGTPEEDIIEDTVGWFETDGTYVAIATEYEDGPIGELGIHSEHAIFLNKEDAQKAWEEKRE